MSLLRTREGNYSSACAIDYGTEDKFYDTFALRDSNGLETATQRHPFFGQGPSRDAVLANKPAPVKSCWNGMGMAPPTFCFEYVYATNIYVVAFDAAPFTRTTSPLRFRATPDSLAKLHLDASECCLIHADNPITDINRSGVWVNPAVRVAYNMTPYEYQKNYANGWYEWSVGIPIRIGTNLIGLPWQKKVIKTRFQEWKNELDNVVRHEPGDFCLVDEMQVLADNGWRHA